VTRTALQNAASVAGLMLMTEVMVAEIPEEKPKIPPMLGGGGICTKVDPHRVQDRLTAGI